MFKRRKSILCLLIAVLMMALASTAAMAASPYETRYNNTVMASSVASISESGLLTVDNQFQGIRGKTTNLCMSCNLFVAVTRLHYITALKRDECK